MGDVSLGGRLCRVFNSALPVVKQTSGVVDCEEFLIPL